MVNVISVQRTLISYLMKLVGMVPQSFEIEPGTTMNIWIPKETIKKPKKSSGHKKCNDPDDEDETKTCKPTKPVVVLLQGFFADGIYNWQFQVGSLTKQYSVYVPDLMFFGGSFTDSPGRTLESQADFLAKGLRKLGIERCTLVGFSYGGMLAFKMAELNPGLVEALVITGSVLAMQDSIRSSIMEDTGYSTFSELLLPNSVQGTKALLNLGSHKKLWLPDWIYKDFLEVMFNNKKEKAELLEGLLVSNEDARLPNFRQRIHLIWGENDMLFKPELVENLKEQLGSKTTVEKIKKAGHLAHIERPFVYNRSLKRFLASLHEYDATK